MIDLSKYPTPRVGDKYTFLGLKTQSSLATRGQTEVELGFVPRSTLEVLGITIDGRVRVTARETNRHDEVVLQHEIEIPLSDWMEMCDREIIG